MTNISLPKSTYAITGAGATVANEGQRVLFVGQKLPAGTATAGALTTNIGNSGEEDALFGQDSMLAYLIRAHKVRNKEVRVDAIALDDNGAGVAAFGAFNIGGTATESGTIEITVGSSQNFTYSIAVEAGDTGDSEIEPAIVAAINADANSLVTAGLDGSQHVLMTAKNVGTFGNSIPLSISGDIAGLSIVQVLTPFQSGSGNPVLTGVLDVIGEDRYNTIVWGYPDDTSEVVSLLDSRFDVDEKVLSGVAFTAKNGTVGNLETLGNGLNSKNLVIIGGELVTETNYAGGDIVEIPLVKAAIFAGYRALRLDSAGYRINDFVSSTNGALDAFGGPALATKPYFNMPFPQLDVIETGRGFDKSEIATLNAAGITVLGNNPAATGIFSGEVVTTYKTDTTGNPDVTFKYLNYVDTSTQAVEYFFNNNRKTYGQTRLKEGGTFAGRDEANVEDIRSYQKQLFGTLGSVEFDLVESGLEAVDFFNENLVVTVDKSLGKVIQQMELPIITQIRSHQVTVKIGFTITA